MPTIPTPKLPEWMDPEQASVFDPLHEVLIKKAVETMGGNDPSDMVNNILPGPMMANQGFKVGNRILKKVGDTWQWLDEAQSTTFSNKMKNFETPQIAKSIEDVKTVTPPTGRPEPPKLSGKWGTQYDRKLSSTLSKTKLNTSMIQDIKKRGLAGEMVEDILDDYPEATRPQILDIIKGRTWNWLK